MGCPGEAEAEVLVGEQAAGGAGQGGGVPHGHGQGGVGAPVGEVADGRTGGGDAGDGGFQQRDRGGLVAGGHQQQVRRLHQRAQPVGFDYRSTRGQLYAGYDRSGVVFLPTPAAPVSGMEASATVAAAWSRLSFLAAPRLQPGGALTADALYAAATLGRVQAWAGRRAPGFGAADHGSAVLGGAVAFNGAGLVLDSVEPVPFLGPERVELLGARLHQSGALTRPWFGAARIWLRPHPRLWLGANRAFTLGGDGNTPLHPADLGRFLLGLGSGAHGETENQVASLEARWRAPIAALPVVAYGEWALDDLGFSFVKVPGIVAGLELPALPGAPDVALGLEATSFAGHCCRNPPWYRHSALPWIERRIPLGHPLGGQGVEWVGYGRADLLGARLRLAGEAFLRDRGPENLYSPQWQGRSHGAQLSLELSLRPAMELFAAGDTEDGRDWRASDAKAGVRVRY